jgi:amidase
LGLTSRGGVIPVSLTFDTTGVMTRNVRDLAIVLDAIAGADPQDAATLRQPKTRGSYVGALGAQPIKGARLGVITNFRGANAEVDAVEQAALKQLEAQGAVLVPVMLPKELEDLWNTLLRPVRDGEFKPQFERYLQTLPAAQPHTLAEVITISASRAVLDSATPVEPVRLQGLRDAQATQLTDSPIYIHLLTEVIPSVRQELKALMTSNQLQAFVFSTMSCPATPRFDRADPSYRCNSDDPYKASYIASAAGFPEVTVPVGRTSANLPDGISFMGLPYHETKLLGLANALEVIRPPMPRPQLR